MQLYRLCTLHYTVTGCRGQKRHQECIGHTPVKGRGGNKETRIGKVIRGNSDHRIPFKASP